MALYLGSKKVGVTIESAVPVVSVAEGQLKASKYPSYIYDEVVELANKVRAVHKDESIVFIAMSDTHYCADQVLNYYENETNASALQANQAAKVLACLLDIDFFAHLGDVSCGAQSTTPDMLKKQIEGFVSYFREAKSDLPVFLAIGNHDAGIYYHDAQTDGAVHTMTGEYLYNNFTAYSESDDTVVGGAGYGGYCYRDFADKKLRVIMLNTSEKLVGAQKDNGTYGAQRLWLANTLLDLNSKSDASSWGFIILCHYPADYGANINVSELLKAYVDGNNFTITDPYNDYIRGDQTNASVNFTGKNSAKFISQFHGHVHNFKTSRLHSYSTGSGVQYNAHRICIPNGQFNRENYYTTIGNYTDINFSEDKKYSKTAGTANGTSFVVNVINPSEEKIYSFCYGAGYDRVIGYGAVTYYTVSRTLTNVTTNNTNISVEEGKPYSEVIMLNGGCDMKTITVTMGGVDISSTAITTIDRGYQIDIPEVTGNVVVTAKAQARPNFTNLVPLSINSDGTDYYVDGDGYKNNTYISGGSEGTATNVVTTGFIPVPSGTKVIRIAGDGISADPYYTRIETFDANFNWQYQLRLGNMTQHANGSYYNGRVIEEDSTVLTVAIESKTNGCNDPYIRICTSGNGEGLIVTVDEEITYGGSGTVQYTIGQKLSNVTSSNTRQSIEEGGAFSTKLTANSGYELGTVTVVMGGLDVTSSVYANGQITIAEVVGDVVITATANAVAVSYTNQLPISTDTDGSVYNGCGYKADSYLSSGTVGSRTGVFTSGFIPCKAGDTLYFKNVTLQDNQSNHRFTYYDSSKTYVTNAHFNTSNDSAAHITITYDANGNIATATISATSSYGKQMSFLRFCCSYLGADSIVTVNEPIE